jgi:competence protein ComEC
MGRKVLVLALIFILFPAHGFARHLTVVFLDVGKGDAIFIQTPEGRSALVDSGNLITGYRIVNFLMERGVEELDMLIITHPHPDHMGGVFHLLQGLKVKARFDNGQTFQGKYCKNVYGWYSDLFRKDDYTALSSGRRLKLGNATMEVLSPGQLSADWNGNSLVIRLRYGNTTFLLMGDAGTEVELNLAKRDIDLDADVLKVSHHGSSYATSGAFLDMVTPEYAVVSVDEDNIRGYPDPEVIQRFNARSIGLFLTFRDGDITFVSDGEKIRRLPRAVLP